MDDLATARRTLLTLHRELLDWQRRQVERASGRMSAGDALRAAIDDPRFSWLNELTAVVAELDAARRAEEEGGPTQAALARARALLDPPAPDGGFGRRYLRALQEDPGIVLAHRDAVAALQAAGGR